MSASPLKWVEINLAAIRGNLRWAMGALGRGTGLLAVVKADAYGHGAVEVARLALAAGAAGAGVLTLAEAAELRRAGIRGRILVMSPPLPGEAAEAARLDVDVTVDNAPLARALSKAARRRKVRVHLDLDYGLGRWGLPPRELPAFQRLLDRLPGLETAGLSAHLDYVPGKNAVEAEDKLRHFARVAETARAWRPTLERHVANSSILLDFPHRRMDLARVGNLLYGINRTSKAAPLKNPFALKARVISLKTVGKGRSIGYASEYLAPRRMTVAALPAGYADGLAMEPAERFIGFMSPFHYYGRLRGRKVPFVGRVGISHVLVDVSGVPGVRVGDEVTLPVRRTAASSRLPRIYT
ncbi:MAG: alanine racemase [Elusimicrobia bacterium]|nr:alanine racemase [Elusimicrobiota bacterium]